ncbi:hypothetical protein [Cellulomonas massiliensis]|uniref:hypothetical protein n=1 Tax=Cellulomonas massiliensis TaxID=1465811 RepID=UPI0003783A5A|nr:hypothetical protein [Cellulomonas massiliensis]
MAGEFWFNTETHEVEEGRRSDWTSVMGPYPSREAAEKALQTAKSRNEKWDEEDEARR